MAITTQEFTVYIIDDDRDMRESAVELLEYNNINAKGFASAGPFLKIFSKDLYGCIVLDVRMPKINGLSLQKKLNELGSKLPIIFITAHGDVDMAVTAMKSGAFDFIRKPFDADLLLEKINKALENEKQRCNHIKSYMEDGLLTNREHEIMGMLLKARTSKQISHDLGISSRTVEVHRQHILKKFKVKSVMQLLSMYNESRV